MELNRGLREAMVLMACSIEATSAGIAALKSAAISGPPLVDISPDFLSAP
jgi:hypothetical protein